MASFNVRIDDRHPALLWPDVMAGSRSRRLSTFDAAYLELALRLGLPLATIDAKLTRAAAAAGVPIFTP
jgi:predicted nucleic acid-binding protein